MSASSPRNGRGWDYLPAIPAATSLVVLVGYVRLMNDQGDKPLAWFVGGLVLAGAASVYGAWRRSPLRAVALAAGGTILVGLGVLALFSVGFPLLVAGGVALLAAIRSSR